ncbi:MAG: bifunctional oligoribonuclease/PAP phosphatase NrnA [Lachnospiraceae bacterium]|nr:bifunctional oligoribonuclease/PAP phosphatase NrnA [Lachnospiraceae bacterium]
MNQLENWLAGAKEVAIAGHVRPDGDCIGSCLGLFNYIQDNFSGVQVTVYIERPSEVFDFLKGIDSICYNYNQEKSYDVFFSLDCGDKERLGEAAKYFDLAKHTICIDHHISNTGFAEENYIKGELSSTCEFLCEFMEEEKISVETAKCLYTGIAHDTGVFQYSNTTAKTLSTVGMLIDKGFDFTKIVDETIYQKTYKQQQITGRALLESMMVLEGKVIFSAVHEKDMKFYGVTSKDLEGIVSQLRTTKGVEVAIFMYELEPRVFKVSMRSNSYVNVSEIASFFGGGGHVRAAGCTMQGGMHDVINNLTGHIEKQIVAHEQPET